MPAATLEPGLTHTFTYPVPPERTVPHLYPEAPEFAPMPAVFATGYLVGLASLFHRGPRSGSRGSMGC